MMMGLRSILKDFTGKKPEAQDAPAVEPTLSDGSEGEDDQNISEHEAAFIKNMDQLIAVLEQEGSYLAAGRIDSLTGLQSEKEKALDQLIAAAKSFRESADTAGWTVSEQLLKKAGQCDQLAQECKHKLEAHKHAVLHLHSCFMMALEKSHADGTYAKDGTLSRPGNLSQKGLNTRL
ncbi:hypothetical protein JCM17846_10070 [Iodidimonas nitroreducens]|uniref:Flagellar protein FlgN n=1 Tax=Iodidimonas nitroreducens TaxID=1236968 RepID=A0A5A7N6Q5_9PROT|nr:flagellar export chaperone FlgN [Iodidimonas nitroreducens]GER03325.1 hypothetical protein JCM17846_10070 [Iodidimonas nitroreducens]